MVRSRLIMVLISSTYFNCCPWVYKFLNIPPKLIKPRIGKGVQINYDCTFIDNCMIIIGTRTLVGPNCSFFSGTHPLDPFLCNGIKGPELGAPITIGEECWGWG